MAPRKPKVVKAESADAAPEVIKTEYPDDPLVGVDGIQSISRDSEGNVLVIVTAGGVKVTDPVEIKKILDTQN